MKKCLLWMLIAVLCLSFSACAKTEENSIYYLNFKPESAEIYEAIAKAYEAETGVKVRVSTAADGTYEQTLKSEMAKTDAPTIFQINGPRGYASWKEYCGNLKGTKLYNHLTDKTLAITDGDGVYAVPYVVEGYGIIYNNAIMDRYFALDGAQVKSMAEINGFDDLKAVVEDMTAKKEELGIEGVFASTSLKSGQDWRWHTHLANLPIYYEFRQNSVDLSGEKTKEISFSFQEEFKNIFDLYLNHSVTEAKLLGSKEVADSMAEFALGRCAMVQNGNWAWGQISDVAGNTVEAGDVKFMPIYTGVPGEDAQGLCIGTENYICINGKASAEKQNLAADFLYWLYSSDTGKKFVTEELKFIAPFDTFKEADLPTDPLALEVVRFMENKDLETVPWNFTVFPGQTFKNRFGASLLQYAQGTKDWDSVHAEMVADWKAES